MKVSHSDYYFQPNLSTLVAGHIGNTADLTDPERQRELTERKRDSPTAIRR